MYWKELRTKISLYLFAISLIMNTQCSAANRTIHIFGSSKSDITNILKQNEKVNIKTYNTPDEVAQAAKIGEAVMVLAENYPSERVKLSEDFFRTAKEKELKVFIEYPAFLPDIKLDETIEAHYERVVANSSFFNGMPDSLQVLSMGGLNFIPAEVNNGVMVAARVAGFDSAIFGLPEKTYPLLFEMPDQNILVSTTSLSKFVSGRYAPKEAWGGVWESIIDYLLPKNNIGEPNWHPVLKPAYAKDEVLPDGFQKQSIEKGINWFIDAKMLIPDNYENIIKQNFNEKINTGWISWSDTIPKGDGSNGVFEGIFSKIDENGNQPIGIVRRADCTGESAMAFACAGKVLGKEKYFQVADNLLDYILKESPATKNEYGDPNHAAYGLVAWGFENFAWYRANYGDDNARLLLGSLITSAITGNKSWDDILMKLLLAQLRTTGKNGFRLDRIDLPQFEQHDWQYFYERDVINLSPHMEAYLWACMLWAYDKTGDPLFLERTEKAIRKTMEHYPYELRWMNGLAQERARMLLPLSWLVRINNTPENRAMLNRVANDVIKLQDECGAIQEELGDLKHSRFPPPQSNEAYGTSEASLIAKNGDKVSDLLYTTNFAFLGLHEAYYATKDPEIKKACDKLAEFLCRAQVDSKKHPEIHGGWMRAFDFDRFEHWGSNADHGWGAWAIESGWTQGWIVSVLSLREMGTSVWDLTKDSEVNKNYPELKKEMMPGIFK